MGYLEKDALPGRSLYSRYSTQQRRPSFDAFLPCSSYSALIFNFAYTEIVMRYFIYEKMEE